jgi:hypothetical protein
VLLWAPVGLRPGWAPTRGYSGPGRIPLRHSNTQVGAAGTSRPQGRSPARGGERGAHLGRSSNRTGGGGGQGERGRRKKVGESSRVWLLYWV